MVERTSGMLTAANAEPVRTLMALQKESVPTGVRLGAASPCGVASALLVRVEVDVALDRQCRSHARFSLLSLASCPGSVLMPLG